MTAQQNLIVGKSRRPTLSRDGRTISVHIPITLRHQAGRKQVVTPPDAAPWIPRAARIDSTLVKAVVRAHRWRDMLESGRHATVRDLAKAEGINESYLSRILRLTLLAPALIQSILEGQQSDGLELNGLLGPLPLDWARQQEQLIAK
ncbi:hypothetical protein FNL56_26830 [Tardiphaga sp. vice304]|uniref:hypothetical protein n=1 Tax=unclassified Tardiphaga TaxID=2631404 RepID=UPI001163F7E2|nr:MULTISPECIES: hypothetical protein [unclassified Tardiphaga]QDM19123.1 hypothetical protein FNL53_26655 [Tardiphaga sp. vice278]QDM24101.1 hypothetical protein FIU28_25335 [Tardiphaga sp. vice154]QDM29329.1 hypothetical protein FNL56_26830 [Tardiphaga sp. vice304]